MQPFPSCHPSLFCKQVRPVESHCSTKQQREHVNPPITLNGKSIVMTIKVVFTGIIYIRTNLPLLQIPGLCHMYKNQHIWLVTHCNSLYCWRAVVMKRRVECRGLCNESEGWGSAHFQDRIQRLCFPVPWLRFSVGNDPPHAWVLRCGIVSSFCPGVSVTWLVYATA